MYCTKTEKRLMGLTSMLEWGLELKDPEKGFMVDVVGQLRMALESGEASLSGAEKVRILKSITRAKVKAFMCGDLDEFQELDHIGKSLVALL
ncbi:hypothetical protein JXA56_00925 [Candidatus Micrarchaeota archaeon]|nr:hypothetical protein [Candidatus Micrarchaeota archaeon]